MKKEKLIRNVKSFSIIMGLLLWGIISCTGQKNNQEVLNAYDLRMNGMADSAKIILTEITQQNPDNAMAWYELSRCSKHLGLANPQKMMDAIAESIEAIDMACEKEPKNAQYLSYKAKMQSLNMYAKLKMGGNEAAESLKEIEEISLKVLKLDPTYLEDQLNLVELFAGLPAEMGGDQQKAEQYTLELEKADLIMGAKAREMMMTEDDELEKFWKEIIAQAPENADAYQALGRVYLFLGDIDQAQEQFLKAMELDECKKDLYLDLGRYYIMMAMQGQMTVDSAAPLAEAQFQKYLDADLKAPNPMKAWTYAKMAMLYRRTQEADKAEKLMAKAKELDPFFSPAFGKPDVYLYQAPDKVLHSHSYYFSPF